MTKMESCKLPESGEEEEGRQNKVREDEVIRCEDEDAADIQ